MRKYNFTIFVLSLSLFVDEVTVYIRIRNENHVFNISYGYMDILFGIGKCSSSCLILVIVLVLLIFLIKRQVFNNNNNRQHILKFQKVRFLVN